MSQPFITESELIEIGFTKQDDRTIRMVVDDVDMRNGAKGFYNIVYDVYARIMYMETHLPICVNEVFGQYPIDKCFMAFIRNKSDLVQFIEFLKHK